MPKPQTPKSLSNLFTKSSGSLARIAEKSQYLNALNHHLVETVGDTIAQKSRVSNYNQGILTIETVNSAFATRLNFMLPQILQNFRENVLPEMASIKIKVVPNEQFYKKSQPKEEKNISQLSEQASQYILAAAQNAPDSLKRKLERLASRVTKKKD
ncbi:MAG: hypothetical protein ACI8WB_000268 [Phenylobacterium sp.]|jgi:hypothetical protein